MAARVIDPAQRADALLADASLLLLLLLASSVAAAGGAGGAGVVGVSGVGGCSDVVRGRGD